MTDSHDDIITVEATAIEERTDRSSLHPLAQAMIDKGATVQDLKDVMNLQITWEERENKKAFTDAKKRLRADLPPYIVKNRSVNITGGPKYSYADLQPQWC